MKGTTSSGLLLLLVGVVLLSAFINGALPRLLELLFSADKTPSPTSTTAPVPAAPRLPSVGLASTGRPA